MLLTQIDHACRGRGLTVVTEPGWETRRRGEMTSATTLVCHHTAGGNDANDLVVVRDGTSNLSGPLSQILLHSDGTVRIISSGRCNHAGTVLQADYGNYHAIGIEAVHDGVSEWPTALYNAYILLVANIIEHYGMPIERVLGHKEVCSPVGRKIDPNFNMASFRQSVQAAPKRQAGERNLLEGLRGNDVKQLQTALKIEADGIFGPNTTTALKEWQQVNGLTADGIAGPQTFTAMQIQTDGTMVPYTAIATGGTTAGDAQLLPDAAREIAKAILDTKVPRQGSSLGGETTLRDIVAHWDKAQELHQRDSADIKSQLAGIANTLAAGGTTA